MHKLEKGMTPARTSTLLSILCFAGALGATAIASPALAHHSFAVYDHTKKVTLEGTVKDWVFANPHSSLTLVVMENGAPVEYLIEGASVNTLIRMGGWSPARRRAERASNRFSSTVICANRRRPSGTSAMPWPTLL